MKLDLVANSKNDEFYTPGYAIYPIIKYIINRNYKNIWCPFDTEESFFVRILRDEGFRVKFSHISTGHDFFKTTPPDGCDLIISNPPYSMKGNVIEHCFNIGIPFALLVGVVGLFESKYRFNMFKNNDFEIMYFNKRISYLKSYSDEKPLLNPPFSSVYICSGVLSERICFEEVIK